LKVGVVVVIDPQYENNNALHGIPMTEDAFEHLISIESPYRYEMIDGIVYDMTGSSPEHSMITGNIDTLFRIQLGKGGPCRTHRDQYVAIPGKPPVVPDVVLTCDRADWDKDKRLKPFRIQSPLIVVEVLSPGTERYDRGEKFARYRRCASLEVYILVSQHERHVEVYRQATGWQPEHFTANQVIQLDQLDLELPLDEIYAGVL
jgi:Uma2 family endonuclease